MNSTLSKIAIRSALRATSGALSVGCMSPTSNPGTTPPPPMYPVSNFSIETISGNYQLESPETYFAINDERNVILPAATVVPLLESALSTELVVSTTSTEVTLDFTTSIEGDSSTLLNTDFTGANLAYRTCEGVTCRIPTVFTAEIQTRGTRAVPVSNGCSAETKEFLALRFSEDNSMTANLYLQTELINVAGTTTGLVGCETLLTQVAARLSTATVIAVEDQVFHTLVINGVTSLADLAEIYTIRMGALFAGQKVIASEEGVAVAPLVSSGFSVQEGSLFSIQSSLISPDELNQLIVSSLRGPSAIDPDGI